MKVLLDITQYLLEDDHLYTLANVGISGNSPCEISIDDRNDEHYAMIAVVKSVDETPKMSEQREGYYVISTK
ncbi:hypothetical protein [Halalkalibacter nanhaiisediminis]|uniref:Uncharacterized protein n=1 Tax=Halalkalibacter nanhaiisediminis TaxID=688079 RepID=A0A562QQK9_9BACI|nr:hypothetical protein [Halalkalibacter nanhaiisediminis]TWI58997.1 hypothetical protein IQ10_00707 [Halalkalibacter nanhaiisediminis]